MLNRYKRLILFLVQCYTRVVGVDPNLIARVFGNAEGNVKIDGTVDAALVENTEFVICFNTEKEAIDGTQPNPPLVVQGNIRYQASTAKQNGFVLFLHRVGAQVVLFFVQYKQPL